MATNTQFALGVHMLTLLAGSAPATLSSEEMAVSGNANPAHIRRVLGGLRAAGLVTSKPGAGGGWQLNADPATITLADVWHIVHGDDNVLGLRGVDLDCQVGQSVHAQLVDLDRRAQHAISDELAATTIAQLVAQAIADMAQHAPA